MHDFFGAKVKEHRKKKCKKFEIPANFVNNNSKNTAYLETNVIFDKKLL